MSGAEEDLIDYSDEEINTTEVKATNGAAKKASDANATKGSYVDVHTSAFRDLLLKPEIQKAITDCGFEHPSAVQQACIPQAIVGTDVICQAKSGLGKTAVFVISTLQQLDTEPVEGEAQVIVMCHTRELAYQIKNEYARFTKYLPKIRTAVFYGGVDMKNNEKILSDKKEYPTIIVGTPGRLHALVRDKKLRLGSIKMFVLDECDKMLDQVDMRRDVQEVFRATPTSKQVMMFSATLSDEVKPICKKFMKNPLELYVDDEKKLTLHGLRQYEVVLDEGEKNRQLNAILDDLQYNQVIIFVKNKARAVKLAELLVECQFPAIAIYAGLDQEERIRRYQLMKDFKCRFCVATDLLGRGIDLERINLAINYDMPEKKENGAETDGSIADCANSYLHRVGRAGRFGTKGIAISFVSSDRDAKVLDEIKRKLDTTIEPYPTGGAGVSIDNE